MIPVVSTGHKAFDYQNSSVFIGLKPKISVEKTATQDCIRLALYQHDYGFTVGDAITFLDVGGITFSDVDKKWVKAILKDCFHVMGGEYKIETAYLYFLHHMRKDCKIVVHGAILTHIEPSFRHICTWNKQANNTKTERILTEMQRFLTGKTFHISPEIAITNNLQPNKRYSMKIVFGLSMKQYLRRKTRILQAPI